MKSLKTFVIAVGAMLVLAGLTLMGVEKAEEVEKLQTQRAYANEIVFAARDRIRYGKQPRPAQQIPVKATTTPNLVGERAPAPTNLVGDRVQLPDVEGHFWLTFMLADNWKQDPESVRLVRMWANDPRLYDCVKRCRVTNVDKLDPYMHERWSKYVGNQYPMLVMQAPDGKVVYKAGRGNHPTNANDQMLALQNSLATHCRPCPKPSPAPTPQTPVQPVSPIPDTVGPNAVPPDSAGDPLWLLGLIGALCLGGGVALGRKRR